MIEIELKNSIESTFEANHSRNCRNKAYKAVRHLPAIVKKLIIYNLIKQNHT
jgi:hypothetical protein